ncbi:MAG TPA: hypothetical protein VGC32_11895 [Solirubrobacterales bacterium]
MIAVGIYRLQERSGNEAHAELMEQLEAQGELLNEYAKRDEAGEPVAGDGEGTPSPVAPADGSRPSTSPAESLTPTQRDAIEDRFGADSIEAAFDPGHGRGRHGRARLVRLRDGRLVSVYEDPRRDRISVREIDPTRRGRPER